MRTGAPVAHPMRDKLLRFAMPEPNSGCWLWTGCMDHRGYGKVSSGVRRNHPVKAHRASYEEFVGPIPGGLWVLHKCDVRGCINPDHLFLGTPKDNSQDMMRKGRGPIGEKQGRSKLTAADVLEIRASNARVGRLAKKFSVTHTTIIRTKRGECWAHLSLSGKL